MPTLTRELPSQDELKRLFSYNPVTGILTWKSRSASDYPHLSPKSQKIMANKWNAHVCGREALSWITARGHKMGTLKGHNTLSHRVIWKMVYGEDPIQIDHIDGDAANNKLDNLRSVDAFENMKNRKVNCSSKHGVLGVRQEKEGSKKYLAQIKHNNVKVHLGTFNSFDEAVAARRAAEVKYGFHPNHGKR